MSKLKPSFFFIITIYCSIQLLSTQAASAQTIPPFKMTMSNNQVFSAIELPKNKPLILIYFDPDCDHCQKLMEELFKKINEFKKAEIVMVTFKPVNELAPFEKKYNTAKYSNIKVGTEGTGFYLRMYYGLMTMPFTALYDKKANLNYTYRKETPVDDLAKRLRDLK
jgi:thiol-disulfide isomerase/thioredoxin